MRTSEQTNFCQQWFQVCRIFLAATIYHGTANLSVADEATKTEPSPYILFLGADIQILQGKDSFYRVQNLIKDSYIIHVNGKEVRVPKDGDPVTLKIDQALRLTESSATIDQLATERTYTPEKDPRQKWMGAEAIVTDISTDTAAKAQATLNRMPYSGAMPVQQKPNAPVNPAPDINEEADRGANDQLDVASSNMSGLSTPIMVQKMNEELALGLFDAINVKFKASSEKPLKNPYILLDVHYHEKDKPETSRTWIFAQAIKSVGKKPRQVDITQGGFPAGFEIEKIQVHLYDAGAEIATNVAEKRVSVSREEALKYLIIEYTNSHKDRSTQAQIAMAKFPSDWSARLKKAAGKKTFFIKVNDTGHPVGIYEDKSCSKQVEDASITPVILDTRFLPALNEGKPVESVVQLKLADLSK